MNRNYSFILKLFINSKIISERKIETNDEYNIFLKDTKAIGIFKHEDNRESCIGYSDGLFEQCIKCDTILINGKLEYIKNFIDNNSFMLNKKIIIDYKFGIDEKNYDIAEKMFGSYKNVYFNIEGNTDAISLEDYRKTISAIEDIVFKIKKYNYSPLEQIMYAYDLIRDRVYEKESGCESKGDSRELTKVLLGDKIVCVGYANIFNKVLLMLGIKNFMYRVANVESGKPGHQRNVVFIEDEKYNVKGIYYFDATWDSRKDENSNNFLNSYKYFAKTKKQMENYQNGKYKDITFGDFSEKFIQTFTNYLDKGGIEAVPTELVRLINKISNFIENDNLINPLYMTRSFLLMKMLGKEFDKETTINKLREYLDYFNREIEFDILIRILYEVRKNEFSLDSEKYKFSFEDIMKIILNSNWKFDYKILIDLFLNSNIIDQSEPDDDRNVKILKNI